MDTITSCSFNTYILTISTLHLSHTLCATATPLSLSSSVTFFGCIKTLAYVPAARRLARVPGLITMTDSTTFFFLLLANILGEKECCKREDVP